MIHRKLSSLRNTMLFNTDDSGNPTPTPATSQENKTEDKGKGEKTITMTEAELQRIAAKEKRDAKAAAEKAFLERFGVASEDELKSKLSAISQADANTQAETKRLSDELNTIKQSLEAEKQARADLEKTRRHEKRDSALKDLLVQAVDSNEVLTLLKASHADKVETLLDEHGNFKKAEAESLIAEYRKDKGHLFKDNRLGSAMSNRDGIAPEPNKEQKLAAQKRTFTSARNSV